MDVFCHFVGQKNSFGTKWAKKLSKENFEITNGFKIMKNFVLGFTVSEAGSLCKINDGSMDLCVIGEGRMKPQEVCFRPELSNFQCALR